MPDLPGLTDPELRAEREKFLKQREERGFIAPTRLDPQTGALLLDGEVFRPDPSDFGPCRVDFSRC